MNKSLTGGKNIPERMNSTGKKKACRFEYGLGSESMLGKS